MQYKKKVYNNIMILQTINKLRKNRDNLLSFNIIEVTSG